MRVPADSAQNSLAGLALYNGLDTQVTLEVARRIKLAPHQERVYRAEMALQVPAMAAGLRGILIKADDRKATEAELTTLMEADAVKVAALFQARLGWVPGWSGLDLSSYDLKEAFFGPRSVGVCPDCHGTGRVETGTIVKKTGLPKTLKCKRRHVRPGLGLKPTKTAKQTGEPSLDKDALEKLIIREGADSLAGQVATSIAEIRYLAKQRQLCRARLRKGRFHYTLSVGATVTFRLSSNSDCMDYGGNSQNLHRVLRKIFIPDPGYVFVAFDLPAAESHLLAMITGDTLYEKAHVEGDSHTAVCQLAWPNLSWTGDIKQDKKLADTWKFSEVMGLPVPGHLTVRDIGKKLNHAAGRWATEYAIARTAKIPLEVAKAILWDTFWPTFHVARDWIINEHVRFRREPRVIIPGLELERKFFGRPDSDDTFRDSLAYRLQAPVVWVTHRAMWNIWRDLDDKDLRPGRGNLQVLKHDHDSVTVQVREELVDHYLPLLKQAATVAIPLGGGRTLTLAPGFKVGHNLAEVK